MPTTQTALTDLPPAAIAGVMSTRAAAQAFFVAGTNRAMFRFTMLNHLCHDMEQVKDTTGIPDRIRQDVSRSPGGDSRIFPEQLHRLSYRHGPSDPGFRLSTTTTMTADGSLYTPGQVQPKYLQNSDNFKFGYVTPDDSWDNYWRAGPNQLLGWDASLPGGGNGAASMGQELANSEAFARCQVKKVFRNVCFRDPVDAADRSQIDCDGAVVHERRLPHEARIRRSGRVLQGSVTMVSMIFPAHVARTAFIRATLMLGAFVLGGCGGGADVTPLAASGNLPPTSTYTGPGAGYGRRSGIHAQRLVEPAIQ